MVVAVHRHPRLLQHGVQNQRKGVFADVSGHLLVQSALYQPFSKQRHFCTQHRAAVLGQRNGRALQPHQGMQDAIVVLLGGIAAVIQKGVAKVLQKHKSRVVGEDLGGAHRTLAQAPGDAGKIAPALPGAAHIRKNK